MMANEGQRFARFAVRVGKAVELRLARYPVEVPPAEGAIAIVDNGTKDRTGTRSSAACFRNGKFRGLAFAPTYWMIPDND